MESFREFEAGPDPFGRTWHVQFKWMLTAISTRGADAIDSKFILACGDERYEKIISMRHPDVLRLSEKTGRPVTDPWCSKLAALHLTHMIETWEDMDKDLVTMSPAELAEYASAVKSGAVRTTAK
jgi:hypothetical protein